MSGTITLLPKITKELTQPNASTPTSIIRVLMRMYPPTKVVDAIGVTPLEKAELAVYQLKEVAQVWYDQWRGQRPLERGLVVKEDLLERFFSLE